MLRGIGPHLEGFLQLIFGDVAAAVFVEELEGLEHILLFLQLAEVDCGCQEFPVVDAACNHTVSKSSLFLR